MNDHWSVFNNKSERYILKYYADIGRKMTKYYADIVIPLNESRPLKYVYQAEYRVDKEKYYYPILFHAYMSHVITVAIVLSIDTTYIICVLHACSLFAAISHRLENIVGQTNVKTDDNEKICARTHYHLFVERYDSIDDDYHELRIYLRKHQLALEYVQILDSTFTYVTFVLLFLNVLIMSVIGIQLINKLGHTEEVIKFICVTVGSFTHLICLCFPGQLIIDRSMDIFDKAYSSGWYTFSIKSKTLLKILLYRSFVPCTLSAGKMFVMSMTMCSSVRL
ncbi:Odorant receptor 22b [Formica fusca]